METAELYLEAILWIVTLHRAQRGQFQERQNSTLLGPVSTSQHCYTLLRNHVITVLKSQ